MEELFGLTNEDSSLTEDQIRDYLKKRVIILNTGINDCLLEDVILYIIKWNKEDEYIPVPDRKPIWIYIQSVGGTLIHGFNLIDVIESSKTPIHTLRFAECASMGFHIFITGHKRYAFKNSILLIHDGEIEISNSTSKAKDTMEFIGKIDNRVREHVLSHTGITSDFYESIYNKEYYIYANEEGKELGCVDFIIGEDVKLSEIL